MATRTKRTIRRLPDLATKLAKLTNEASRLTGALHRLTEEVAAAERELEARRLRDTPPPSDSPAYGLGRLMADVE